VTWKFWAVPAGPVFVAFTNIKINANSMNRAICHIIASRHNATILSFLVNYRRRKKWLKINYSLKWKHRKWSQVSIGSYYIFWSKYYCSFRYSTNSGVFASVNQKPRTLPNKTEHTRGARRGARIRNASCSALRWRIVFSEQLLRFFEDLATVRNVCKEWKCFVAGVSTTVWQVRSWTEATIR
jgi:hypothetical protein